jgi:CBS domain containing-hemolysin-like protein
VSDWAGIAWLFVLLAFNAFFVGAEFAVISARRSQIEPLAEKGSRAAKTAIHHLLAEPLGLTGLAEGTVDVIAFVIALVLVSYLHVVFGEMVPKNLAFSVPDRAVLMLATPLVWVSRLFHPVIFVLNWIANHAVRLFGVEPKDEAASTFTLEEVTTIVNQSRIEGVLDDAAGTLSAALEFTDKRAKDIAVPLSQLVTLPESVTPDEIERSVAKYGFSRYVIVDAAGLPLGYVHLKDVLRAAEGPDAATDVVRPIPGKRIHQMVPVMEGTDLEDALALMRRAGRHLARVRDADGDTTGVLFLEDIIEELIGEVQDATRRRA